MLFEMVGNSLQYTDINLSNKVLLAVPKFSFQENTERKRREGGCLSMTSLRSITINYRIAQISLN